MSHIIIPKFLNILTEIPIQIYNLSLGISSPRGTGIDTLCPGGAGGSYELQGMDGDPILGLGAEPELPEGLRV